MEIKWLEDFVSLANTRSFSRSAVERRVTQSAFSRRIQQGLLFGFGGLTVLGVDLLNMALPGVLLAMAVRPFISAAHPTRSAALAGLAAALSVLVTAGLVGLEIAVSEPAFAPAVGVMAVAYLPLSVLEAAVTAFVTLYLLKVKPEMIGASALIGTTP